MLLSLEEEEVLFKVNDIWIRIIDLERKVKENLLIEGMSSDRLVFKIIN